MLRPGALADSLADGGRCGEAGRSENARRRAVPRRNVGADGAPLGQDREGLLHEEQKLRHLEDTGHLRLHQVRPAAQPAHAPVRPGGGAVHLGEVSRGHRDPAGVRADHAREADDRAGHLHAAAEEDTGRPATQHRGARWGGERQPAEPALQPRRVEPGPARTHAPLLHQREPRAFAADRAAARRAAERADRRAVAPGDGLRVDGVRAELHVADRDHAVRGPDEGSQLGGAVPRRAAL